MRISINQGIAGHVATTGQYSVYVVKNAFIIYSDEQTLSNFPQKLFSVFYIYLEEAMMIKKWRRQIFLKNDISPVFWGKDLKWT